MDVWIWVVLAGAAGAFVMAAFWKRRARRVYVIDHVRVEMHPACVVEDRVIEQVWRAAISMTNVSRRPRMLPTFAERATVRAGRREFLGTVFLDVDQLELNPGAIFLMWIEYVLPVGSAPGLSRVALLGDSEDLRTLTFARAVGVGVS